MALFSKNTQPIQEDESGLSQKVRFLLSTFSAHLLALLKLGRMEASEAQGRIGKKIVFLAISLVFFLGFYLCVNVAGAFYLHNLVGSWRYAFLILSGSNLILGLVFAGISTCFKLSPLFQETLTELENDLIWLKERRNAKRTSSEN